MNKELVSYAIKFQKGQISRREFLREINDIILKTPRYSGVYDKDIIHEFYAFFISKIDKIITRYKVKENASFNTWFNIVLKRSFINFYKNYKNHEENETVEYIDNYPINGSEKNLLEAKSFVLEKLNFLSENEKTVLSLKFGLNINSNINIENSLNVIYNKLLNKTKIEEKITSRFSKLLKLETALKNETDKNKINEIKIKIQKTLKNKRNLEKVFYGSSSLPTNKWVGEKLGLTEGTVGAYLNKIKIKILDKYKKESSYDDLCQKLRKYRKKSPSNHHYTYSSQ